MAGLLGTFAVADNPNVAIQDTGGAQPGSYAIDIAANSAGSINGTVNAQAGERQ